MMKNLRYFFVAALAMISFNAMATDVEIACNSSTFVESGDDYVATSSGVTLTYSKGTSTSAISGGIKDDQIRIYKNAILTVSSTQNISKIVVTAVINNQIGANGFTAEGYTYSEDKLTGTWEGSSNSVSLVASVGQVRITKVVVTLGAAPDVVAPQFSVASGMYFEAQNVEMTCSTEGADIYYTTNGSEPTASSTKYTSAVTVSATTTLKAIAIKGGKSSSVTTATYTIINTTGKGTAESPFTVADALAIIDVLADGATSPIVYTQGYVVGEITVNSSGQAQFQIGATAGATENLITVFRAKGLENEAYEAGDAKAGDLVVINAALQRYVKNEVVTPETQYGYIYSINGQTSKEGPALEGDGSENNPFTANDLIIMKTSQRPTDAAWVKGVIRGTFKNKTQLDEDKASNIAIATSATATEFAPVELKANSVFREKLNVVDNPSNKGKEVLLKGTITGYFSVTGVKDLVEAKLDGEIISGIEAVKANAKFEGKTYNVAGQLVNKGYKGLVIMNGRKFVNK